MVCGNCGGEIAETANFCRHCGAAQAGGPADDVVEAELADGAIPEELDSTEQLRAAVAALQSQVSFLTSRIAALESSITGPQSQVSQRPSPEPTSPPQPAPPRAVSPPAPQVPQAPTAYPATPQPVTGQDVAATPERPSSPDAAPAIPASTPVSSRVPAKAGDQANASARRAGASMPLLTSFNWEWLLGGNWLARIGIVALMIGVGFFLKLAFDNQWIGETGRVLLGLGAGVALLAAGEFWRRTYPVWAPAVAGGGIAILYLSIFAAFGLYQLIGGLTALGLAFLVTAATAGLALRYEALVIAILGILGGFATPVFLSQDVEQQWALLGYVLVLDLGVLSLAAFRNWRWFTFLALVGSLILYGFWVENEPAPSLLLSQTGITLIFLIFVGATTLYHLIWRRPLQAFDQSLMVINAMAYLAISYNQLFDVYREWMGAFTVLLSAFYGLLSYGILLRNRDQTHLSMFAVAIALVLLAIAVPVQLSGPSVVVAWAAQGAALTWLSFATGLRQMRWFGLAFFAVVLGWMLVADLAPDLGLGSPLSSYANEGGWPFFNFRILAYLMVIAAGYLTAFLWRRSGQAIAYEWERFMPAAFLAGAQVLTLWILSIQMVDLVQMALVAGLLAEHLEVTAISLSLGGCWGLYAVALLVAGKLGNQPPVRLAGLAVLALAIARWFLLDIGTDIDLVIANWGSYDQDSYRIVFDVRIAAYVILVAGAYYAASLWKRSPQQYVLSWESRLPSLLVAAANLLTLWVLSVMVVDAVNLATNYHLVTDRQFPNVLSLSLGALWAAYAGGLVYLGARRSLPMLRAGGMALLAICAGKWLLVDTILDLSLLQQDNYHFHPYWFLYNVRLAAYLVLIGVSYGSVFWWKRIRDGLQYDWEHQIPLAVSVAANLFTLWILSVMVADAVGLASRNGFVDAAAAGNATSLSLSVLWALYATVLIALGIVRQERWLRTGGLALLAIPVLKLFSYDAFQLEAGYRVGAFMGLGALLVLGGFLYQRYSRVIRGFLLE